MLRLSTRNRGCQLWHQFDYSAAASVYAGLAGVLAGIAFVAITIVIGRQHRRQSRDRQEEDRQDNRCLTALGCAFVGLVISTALYGVIAGERDCALTEGRVASEEVLSGVAFSFSIYTLFFAAVQIVSVAPFGAPFRFIVAVLTPPVLLIFITKTLTDLALTYADPPRDDAPVEGPLQPRWLDDGEALWNAANDLAVPLAGSVFTVCLLVWWLGRRIRKAEGHPGEWASRLLVGSPFASLSLILYAVLVSQSLSNLDPGAHIGPAKAWTLLGLAIALVVAQSALLSLVRGSEHAPDTPVQGPAPAQISSSSPFAQVLGLAVVAACVVGRLRR